MQPARLPLQKKGNQTEEEEPNENEEGVYVF
jgi:hypothetical protein